MKNKAFTLIELLAVIVILAIIALIATPLILNIIEKARKNAFLDSVYGIVDSARLYYTESLLDGTSGEAKVFSFEDENNELMFGGRKPKGGMVAISKEGKVSIAIYDNHWCAKKSEEESSITLSKYEIDKCTLDSIPEVPDEPDNGQNIEEIMKGSDHVMAIDPDSNLRYVGGNPNNFVSFNKELWRIIGVFDGQMKIIRNDFRKTVQWDQYYKNNWIESTIMKDLNDKDNTSSYINQIKTNDLISYNQIDLEHVWNIGSISSNETSNWTRSKAYQLERGEMVAATNGSKAIWIGPVGLMYPSDYGYATSSTYSSCENSMYSWRDTECINSNYNWLVSNSDDWTITSDSYDERLAICLKPAHFIDYCSTNASAYQYNHRPTIYLKKNIKIISGEGTIDNPYIFGM